MGITLLLQGEELPALRKDSGGTPGRRWVTHKAMAEEGLSSGVRKVFKLSVAADGSAKKGIKRFLASTTA
jgi:hypothetical protein